MKLGITLYVANRKEWRSWLSKHRDSKKEIWLVYYNKQSGKPRIPYNEAVEEALCYGWIDSTVKKIDTDRFAQRFTPRRPNSGLSEMNKERIRRLIKKKKMTKAGLAAIEHVFGKNSLGAKQTHRTMKAEFTIPSDILKTLKATPRVWKNFQRFPASYKRIRIGWIAAAKHRPEIFKQRLRYFLKMTTLNKRFGMVQ